MSEYYELINEKIKIGVDSFGAELKSLQAVQTGREYLWNADPKFWKRTSPVLFPLVGGLVDGKYRYEGREYQMSQHGFARDMEFSLVTKTDDEIWFALEDTAKTLEKYPFRFRLEVGYRITDHQVEVLWRVKNQDTKKMYFSIGGHPAFLCPTQEQGYDLVFDETRQLVVSVLGEGGLLSDEQKTYPLEKGRLAVTKNLFDEDALIIEKHQAHQVSLVQEQVPYLTVSFDAPLFGIWSPPHKNAPFVCIEPWYGRCDRSSFDGSLEQREWGNELAAGESFAAAYRIVAENV